MSEQSEVCDIIVIGAGPAGLTTDIYSSWLGLDTVILEAGVLGGRAWEAPNIGNFPGFEDGIKGRALSVTIVTHENELKMEGTLKERLQNKPNVEIVKGQVVA